MQKQIEESDWKLFKKVRKKTLDRFCHAVLKESEAICNEQSRTAHERYGTLYGYLQESNREMAAAFDDLRRSTAVLCLIQFRKLGLLEDEDIEQFSEGVQRSLENAAARED